MRDGRIVSDNRTPNPVDAAEVLAGLPPLHIAEDDAEPTAGRRGLSRADVAISGSVPWSVYPKMWLGDLCGELVAASYVVFILHLNAVSAAWASIVFGEVAKAWAGARWGRRAAVRFTTSDQRWQMAFGYTFGVTGLGLAVVTATAMWPRPAQWFGLHVVMDSVAGVLARGWFVFLAAVAASVAGIVLLRYLLLSLFVPRR
jgi:hypothetical protein